MFVFPLMSPVVSHVLMCPYVSSWVYCINVEGLHADLKCCNSLTSFVKHVWWCNKASHEVELQLSYNSSWCCVWNFVESWNWFLDVMMGLEGYFVGWPEPLKLCYKFEGNISCFTLCSTRRMDDGLCVRPKGLSCWISVLCMKL